MLRRVRDRVAILVGGLLLRALAATWRVVETREVIGDPEWREGIDRQEAAVILFTHGQMFPIWHRYRGTGAVPVISQSRDGELLTGLLRVAFGYRRFIRGSSSRRGGEVLSEVIDTLEHHPVLMTPDGPRGPVGIAKAGGVVAAARTGRRIDIVTARASHAWSFDSWDQMRLPHPFARVYIRYCTTDVTINSITETITRVSTILTSSLDQSDGGEE